MGEPPSALELEKQCSGEVHGDDHRLLFYRHISRVWVKKLNLPQIYRLVKKHCICQAFLDRDVRRSRS